jgi:uncharacterized protein (TIGR02147 family)
VADPEDPEVFDYLDYRAFLRDYYLERKRQRGASYRSLSKRIGLKSSNYFKLVLDGARNLTDDMARRFASATGLRGESAEYFIELVRFNQAKTSEARNEAYERITGFKRYRQIRPLESQQAEYHSTWYLPAIRELVARRDFREDPAWIASIMQPPISKSDAERALKTLVELGLLTRDKRGRLSQGDPVVSTGAEARYLHIANYHRMMLKMAENSMELLPQAERDITSLTLCLGDQGLALLKERLQKFRRELLELSVIEKNPKQVIQVNFQLFPLSKTKVES